jgi:hypothetical protein
MNPVGLFRAAIRQSTEGPDVTWVGPNPFQNGLCLGFDNGTIIFSATAAKHTTGHQQISPSKEAINGVAAIGSTSLAVSTRADVTFIEIISPQVAPRAVFDGGTHGVVATKSGYFVAPRGAKGLLIVKPDREPEQKMRVTTGMDRQLYFYRMIALHDASGKETLVFANRKNGVGLCEFKGNVDNRNVHTLSFNGLDVVDVCGVAVGSLSAVAISPKAEVLWIKDTSKHDDPITTKMSGIEGHVYRVLATARSLFVLSSKALYVWTDLVEHVLFNKKHSSFLQPLVIPMEAVDMSLIDNEYLFLVLAVNGIASLKISDLEKQPFDQSGLDAESRLSIEMSQKTKMEDFVPRWERHDIQQGMMATAN